MRFAQDHAVVRHTHVESSQSAALRTRSATANEVRQGDRECPWLARAWSRRSRIHRRDLARDTEAPCPKGKPLSPHHCTNEAVERLCAGRNRQKLVERAAFVRLEMAERNPSERRPLPCYFRVDQVLRRHGESEFEFKMEIRAYSSRSCSRGRWFCLLR